MFAEYDLTLGQFSPNVTSDSQNHFNHNFYQIQTNAMTGKSRWADDEADKAARKREMEEKKRSKLEKQQRLEQAEAERKAREADAAATARNQNEDDGDRPAKRRKLPQEIDAPRELLRFVVPSWGPSRHVSNFELLNHIDEGTYGWVSRARESSTGEIVALKKLKMDRTAEYGFPVMALREIQMLQESRHKHIVGLREVVVGDGADDVYVALEFVEHDLRTLQEDMDQPFMPSEVKTLMLQITSAVEYLHDHWILHRDLKTSNILMNNRGEIKLADFGMARHFGDPPPPNLTQLVVTLWYRAPELILGADKYDQAIDIWSLGCVFGELLKKDTLFAGKSELDQITKIFELCGLPSERSWPSFRRLPNAKALKLPINPAPAATYSVVRTRFPLATNAGAELLNSLLALNPASRPSASEVLAHRYFRDDPKPKASSMFPTFPSKAGMERRRKALTPEAPIRGDAPKLSGEGLDFSSIFANRE